MYGLPFCILWNYSPILKMNIGNAREMGFCIMTCIIHNDHETMNIPNLIGIWLAWVCNVREVWVWCSEKLAFQELRCAWFGDQIRQQMEDDLNGRFKRGLGGYMLQSVSSTRGWERLSQLVASQSLWSGFPRFLAPYYIHLYSSRHTAPRTLPWASPVL